MTVAAFLCLAVALFATAAVPVVLFADPTVDTYRPAWADHLTARPLLLTGAALLMLLGGTDVR
ncbi:hypothetical protein AB0M10_33025 [Streptomyces sp. NPDC051840]|uniref:hypothetical protein n=1 Tax=Streptomyces sp. NPDC051840 TaxID=3154752 RepID=UPI003419E79B